MKRILIIVPSFNSFGGVETLSKNLAIVLGTSSEVYLVSILDNKECGEKVFSKEPSIKQFNISLGIRLPLVVRWVEYFLTTSKLKKLKKELKIDISISLLWRADLVNALSKQQDLIVSLLVITYKDSAANKLLNKYKFIPRKIYNKFDHILAIGEELGNEFRKNFKINKSKISRFDNFLPPLKINEIRKNREYITFCGRFVPEKNLKALVQIFKEVKKAKIESQLVLVGDGPLKTNLLAYIKTLKLNVGYDFLDDKNDILMLGYQENVQDFINGSKAIVIPSKAEGLPTVALIAAQLKVPIIASDTVGGGMREFFQCNSPNPSEVYIVNNGGVLLPIPKDDCHSTIRIWSKLIIKVLDDRKFYLSLKNNFEKLNSRYSVERAVRFWQALVERNFNV